MSPDGRHNPEIFHERNRRESGSILGLTSALFFNILVYICWHKLLINCWHMPGTGNAEYTRLSPCPRSSLPHHLERTQTIEPTCNTGLEYKFTSKRRPHSVFSCSPSSSLPLLHFYILFLFLTELSWKWNFSGGQLDSKSLCLCATRSITCYFAFCELRVNYIWAPWKSSPIKCRPFPVHFLPFIPLVFIHCYPHRPPLPGLTKADSSKLSFWDCLFHFELDTNYYFWQLNFSACLIQIF